MREAGQRALARMPRPVTAEHVVGAGAPPTISSRESIIDGNGMPPTIDAINVDASSSASRNVEVHLFYCTRGILK